jgi:predicted DNA-binding transcriptional regulator YafY
MNRIDRLFGILTLLQSKKFVTAGFIADKFEISVRTVYRDIKSLAELGIPVSFEQPKGYFVVQGFFLPPLSLTIDEANALILMTSLSEKFADKSITKYCNSALIKLKAVLRYSDKDKAELISLNTSIWSPSDEQPDNEYLSTIQKAIANKTILEIEYTNNQNQFSKRELEPIGLAYYSNQWHLIAWCWKRKEYRDFKIKMISKLRDTFEAFKKTDHHTLNEYIKELQKK